ncbi:MAG: hypothetical protein HWE35_20825 [Rhodobacteraceae bacterium]|nr:hypothetical protein [Paracoccaceae bacterium]
MAHIYRKAGSLRAVQLLPCHSKMDSTTRYPGAALKDALAISEGVEISRNRAVCTGGPRTSDQNNACVRLPIAGLQ